LRTALAAEAHPLAIGIAHSHPEGCQPAPSYIDDDMDGYYASYFQDFASNRPYVSLILSQIEGELTLSGRVYWHGEWFQVSRFAVERTLTRVWTGGFRSAQTRPASERTARLNAAFGEEAASRLRHSTVAIIGAGGTGSAAIEILARAGVGRIIVIDPDFLEESNLERVHGSFPKHAAKKESKAAIARAHATAIDPTCKVDAFVGALPQKEIVDAVLTADAMLGCTDQQHSRLALSDLALRYLIPSIDCGVTLEGHNGKITGQIIQMTRFLPADACALCRRMIIPIRLSQELMSKEERAQRRAAANEARERGEDSHPYWQEEAQLNTVGYLTTIAGAMAAGYVIGWLTGRFDAPFERLQLNLAGKFLDVTDSNDLPRADCPCRRVRGWADQATADALITPPSHWPLVKSL
jgi:tRNA A37 threonylcarbamoyladenosine dehydratase